jgi:hypothetical protein
MDPKACLKLASQALKDSDFETAAEHLAYYREPRIGCYGDGANGHQYTRIRAAMLIEAYAWAMRHPGNAQCGRDIATELRGDMSDDASEECDACDWLNENMPHDGATWDWHDGDFGLWPAGEC